MKKRCLGLIYVTVFSFLIHYCYESQPMLTPLDNTNKGSSISPSSIAEKAKKRKPSIASLSPSLIIKKANKKIEKNPTFFEDSGKDFERTPKDKDKTLSPYFYVEGEDSETDTLPLKETTAEVNIAGVIAHVKIRQVYENHGKKPIEAVYVFPGSTRASVHGMRMKIGERTIEAEIERRKEARIKYEQAKEEGKRASLLEQQRPNVFTMNVANIMPGDKIEVELEYSEFLEPVDGVYEFVYPTVVGPRYAGKDTEPEDNWIANPYLHQGKSEPYKFDIKVSLLTGIPIKDISSPTHKISVNYISQNQAEITLNQTGGGNKDFILKYRLTENQIETGSLSYTDPSGEKFFAVMIEPPQRPKVDQIPPREYIFVLDVSGSMYGFPLHTAKALLKILLTGLRDEDYFNLVLFSGAAYRWHNISQPATSENINEVLEIIEREHGGGGTELMEALKSAYSIKPPKEKGLSRIVIVITDGFVSVENQAFKFIRERLSQANLFAFGIGTSVNRALIEGMARAGLGESFIVIDEPMALQMANKFIEYVKAPVLTDIKVEYKGIKVEEVYPQQIPDLFAKRPLLLIGKCIEKCDGEIVVKGISGRSTYEKVVKIEEKNTKKTKALKWLWARKWVEILEDVRAELGGKDQEIEDTIASLGLNYHILTSQTSFVAIDTMVANKEGVVKQVKQPLPLPEGVSDYAIGELKVVGFGGGSSIENSPAVEYYSPIELEGRGLGGGSSGENSIPLKYLEAGGGGSQGGRRKVVPMVKCIRDVGPHIIPKVDVTINYINKEYSEEIKKILKEKIAMWFRMLFKHLRELPESSLLHYKIQLQSNQKGKFTKLIIFNIKGTDNKYNSHIMINKQSLYHLLSPRANDEIKIDYSNLYLEAEITIDLQIESPF